MPEEEALGGDSVLYHLPKLFQQPWLSKRRSARRIWWHSFCARCLSLLLASRAVRRALSQEKLMDAEQSIAVRSPGMRSAIDADIAVVANGTE